MRTFMVFPVMEYSNSAASNGVIMGGTPLKIDATLAVIVSDFLLGFFFFAFAFSLLLKKEMPTRKPNKMFYKLFFQILNINDLP